LHVEFISFFKAIVIGTLSHPIVLDSYISPTDELSLRCRQCSSAQSIIDLLQQRPEIKIDAQKIINMRLESRWSNYVI